METDSFHYCNRSIKKCININIIIIIIVIIIINNLNCINSSHVGWEVTLIIPPGQF